MKRLPASRLLQSLPRVGAAAIVILLGSVSGSAIADERAIWSSSTGRDGARWAGEADSVPVTDLPCTGVSSDSSTGTPATVRPGDDRCGASGITVPVSPEKIACLQAESRRHLLELYHLGQLKPSATVRLNAAEVESLILTRPIPVQMYAWPVYLQLAAANAQPWSGCAAGVAWKNEIWVSLKDGAVRSERLVAWETANNIVAWGLGRHDLGDSAAVVGGATNRAYSVCSAVPWAMR